MKNNPTALFKLLLITSTSLGLLFAAGNDVHAQVPASQPEPSGSGDAPADTRNRNSSEESPAPAKRQDLVPPDEALYPARAGSEAGELNTIVVTGSHIRGADTSVGSQVISIGREEITQAGHATVRDVFQALPQNFGGGATGEFSLDAGSRNNVTQGNTINLRGLGSIATLVLVNGRRLPATGNEHDVTDVSIIPVTAIERIEVLPDGASAVYGSDAVAGVVNFILRKDFEGLETTARYGAAIPGRFEEYQFGAAAGHTWSSGNALLTYEFTSRERVRATDRKFSRSSDFRSRGGQDRRSIFANPGNIVDPDTLEVLFAIPAGQDGKNLTPDQLLPGGQANYQERSEFVDLMPRQRLHSVYGTASQTILDNLEFFVEGRFSQRKFNNRTPPSSILLFVPPENPFYVDAFGDNRPLYVAYSFHRDGPTDLRTGRVRSYSATAGFTFDHGGEWQTEAWASYVKESSLRASRDTMTYAKLSAALRETDPAKAFNPFGDGSNTNPDVLAQLFSNTSDVKVQGKVRQANIVTSGPLLKLGSDYVRVAAGVDGRIEEFSNTLFVNDELDTNMKVKRNVGALFGEVFIPLITEADNIPGFNKLIISSSIRYERYKDKSVIPESRKRDSQHSTDPRVGILWSLVDGFNIRASYGTSFRAPGLHLLTTPNYVATLLLPDSSSPTGSSLALIAIGSAEDITNETSDNFTMGVELQPTESTNLKISYFKIKFKNQVIDPNYPTALIDPSYAELVIWNPNAQQLADTCALAAPGNLDASPESCSTPGIVRAIVDARSRNFSRTLAEGFDVSVTQRIGVGRAGDILVSINGTYIANFENAISPRAPAVDRLNTPGNPVDWRLRGSIAWMPTATTTISTFINYTDSYKDIVPDRKISSNTTVDLTVAHNFDSKTSSLLRDLSITLSITNLFNDAPPFYENVTTGFGYDSANADPMGRVVALSLSKRW